MKRAKNMLSCKWLYPCPWTFPCSFSFVHSLSFYFHLYYHFYFHVHVHVHVHAVQKCSVDMQHEDMNMKYWHAAKVYSMDMHNGHVASMCSLDMQHGHAAWTCSMEAAWHCSIYMQCGRGYAAWTWTCGTDMYIQRWHSAQTCCVVMRHGHATWPSSMALQHLHASWTWAWMYSIDMQLGDMNMQHRHG